MIHHRAPVNAVYGDGHDGDVVYTENTQLEATVYANDVTVEAGVVLDVNEWPIYARGTFTVETGAVVHGDGTAASGPDPGSDANTYAPLVVGGIGGDCGSFSGADGFGGGGYYRTSTTGNGGSGGATSLYGGGTTDVDPWWNMQRSILGGGSVTSNADLGDVPNNGKVRTPWAGGNGGGGGASQAASGGGGGQGGGPVVIAARRVVNNGTIRSHGGGGGDAIENAGNLQTWMADNPFASGAVIRPTTHAYRAAGAGNTGLAEPTWTDNGDPVTDGDETWTDLGVPQAGGGGGGQGGNVFLIYDSFSGSEPTVTGGTGGTGFGTGENGENGDTGHVIHLSNR